MACPSCQEKNKNKPKIIQKSLNNVEKVEKENKTEANEYKSPKVLEPIK